MQDVHTLLQKYELLHKKSDILNAAKQSIKVIKNKVKEEHIPLGSSKLGGLPDLPQDWEFPKYKNGYLSF